MRKGKWRVRGSKSEWTSFAQAFDAAFARQSTQAQKIAENMALIAAAAEQMPKMLGPILTEYESRLRYERRIRQERRKGFDFNESYADNIRRELGLPPR